MPPSSREPEAAAAVHLRIVGVGTALQDLQTAIIDDGAIGRAVHILQTAAVDARAGGFTGDVNLLHAPCIHDCVRGRAFHYLGAACQQPVGGSAALVDVLQAAAVDQRTCRQTACLH